jgi:PAS domain-containing protein
VNQDLLIQRDHHNQPNSSNLLIKCEFVSPDAGVCRLEFSTLPYFTRSNARVCWPLPSESLHRRKDGTVFPVEVRTGRFQRGGRLYRLALVRDITDRKRTEAELSEMREPLPPADVPQRECRTMPPPMDNTTDNISLLPGYPA